MAKVYCIVGESGTGKSTSLGNNEGLGIKGLDPKETVMINVMDKDLPFPQSRRNYTGKVSEGGNYFSSTDPKKIVDVLKYISKNREDIKNVVIDDAQYTMADKFMSEALKKGYEKFNVLAKETYDMMVVGKILRSDLNIIFLTHSEFSQATSAYSMKTIGKMLDDKVTLEGLFTILLYTHTEYDRKEKKTNYFFLTNRYMDGNGNTVPAKSPPGMFKELMIPNDISLVLEKANEYYN